MVAGGETGSTMLADHLAVEVGVTREVISNKIAAMETATVAAPAGMAPAMVATSRPLLLRSHGRRRRRRLAIPVSASACLRPPLPPTSLAVATAKDTATRGTGVRVTGTITYHPVRRSMGDTRVVTKEVIREVTVRLRARVRIDVTTAGTGLTIAKGITTIREGIGDREFGDFVNGR
ncbi:hypothetical protein L209DRAFT_434575 [Thermothelomyces heterothallicus CBS 203.75]